MLFYFDFWFFEGFVKATVTSHSHQNKSRTSVVMKNGCFYVDHNRFQTNQLHLFFLIAPQLQRSYSSSHHDEGDGHRVWSGDRAARWKWWLLPGSTTFLHFQQCISVSKTPFCLLHHLTWVIDHFVSWNWPRVSRRQRIWMFSRSFK